MLKGQVVCKSRPSRGTRLSPAYLASICQIERVDNPWVGVRISDFLGTCGLTTSTASAFVSTTAQLGLVRDPWVPPGRRPRAVSRVLDWSGRITIPFSQDSLPRCGPGLVWSGLVSTEVATRPSSGGRGRWAVSSSGLVLYR